MNQSEKIQFWKIKSIHEMNEAEWESLCDGCARCCVYKTEDIDTGEIEYTPIACPLLNTKTCQCTNYNNRNKIEPDCVKITPDNVRQLTWLPETCAYKLVAEGKNLPSWHPLVTGDQESTKNAGMSVRNRVIHTTDINF